MRASSFVASICCSLLASFAALAGAEAPLPLEGRYRLEAPEAARREARTALESAIAGVTPSMRSIFAGAFAPMLEMPDALAIRAEGNVVRVKRDSIELEAPLDAHEHAQRGDAGHTVRVVHRLDGETLVEEQRTRNGTRIDRLERRGELLVLHTELRSPMLREPVRLEARYRAVPSETAPPPADDSAVPSR